MVKNDKEDHQLEELLSNMPKMADHRGPDEIYQAIEQKAKRKRRKKRSIFIPALTAVAAAILFILISPAFSGNVKKDLASSGNSFSEKAVQNSKNAEQQNKSITLMESKEDRSSKALTKESTDIQAKKTAVYEQDLTENDVITYGLFTKDAFLVPVSVVVPKSNSEWITKFKETIKTVPLEEWGFTNIPLLQGDIHYDEATKNLHIVLKREEWSKIPESVELNLSKLIQYSFASQDVKDVEFSDENGDQVELSNIGTIKSTTINKTPKTGYYTYKLNDERNLLVPSDATFETLEEALNGMKEKPNDFYYSVIPDNVNISVSNVNPKQVDIEFKDKVNLLDESHNDYMAMIEGMLLTAKDFGYSSVFFNNIEPLEWEGFTFSEPIKVPYSPNRLPLNNDK